MRYTETRPWPDLRRWVRCLWQLTGHAREMADGDPIVPDGCPEIVLHRADAFAQFDGEGHFEKQPHALVAGQMDRPLRLAPTGTIDVIGIRFEPAALHPLLGGTPMHQLRDRRVDLRDLDRNLADDLQTAAFDRDSPAESIQHVLGRRLEARSTTAPTSVERAAHEIRRSPDRWRPESLAEQFGESARTLQRSFRREIGVSAKLLGRVVRLHRALPLLEAGVNGTETAHRCGYFDQSHLIRDVRQFTGRTPAGWPAAEPDLGALFAGADSD